MMLFSFLYIQCSDSRFILLAIFQLDIYLCATGNKKLKHINKGNNISISNKIEHRTYSLTNKK